MTRQLSASQDQFTLSVRTGSIGAVGDESPASSAGFLVGAGRDLDYRAASLIHHSHGAAGGLYIGIDARGRLLVKDFEQEEGELALSDAALSSTDTVTLHLEAIHRPDGYSIRVTALGDDSISLGIDGVEPDRLIGNIALASHTDVNGSTTFWFDSWQVEGNKLDVHDDRLMGPVVGSQHTLSRGTLKLTAQLMPVRPRFGADTERAQTGLYSDLVELQVRRGRSWETINTARVIVPGYTATFEVEDWDSSSDVPFRLSYEIIYTDGSSDIYFRHGLVRREPIDKDEIIVAAFTGNHNVARPLPGRWAGVDGGWFPWDWGVWFPHTDIVKHVTAHKPDFLFFSGDQVYEGASPTAADLSYPYEDYLYKWYLWYWAFGELTAKIPSVAIPDDHDVYHGNIWGAGGKATPPGLAGAEAQDKGGYKLSPDWVNMVQRTQTSHLPDPYDPTPVDQGIGVYYTDVLYAGVSFAVVEDRKFKSAPGPLLPHAEIWNGWAQNPDFDAKTESDVPGAVLLGERQLGFLEHWAADWSDGTWMKVLLSQSLFTNVASLPDSAASGSIIPSLPILDPGEYAENEKMVSDMDSHGWPQSGRNQALRTMRKAFAVHLAGDQHLGSTVQYGVDDWGDAGFALCVPSVANFWPRRWYPPKPGANRDPDSPQYTGEYEDGFGNKMTVYAVSNPTKSGRTPALLHDLAPGYGIARFNRDTRETRLEAWPRWADPVAGGSPYYGWPVVFSQTDNYGRAAVGYLPILEVAGLDNPVVQVLNERSGEVVYTIRISDASFVPWVFDIGPHTVVVGEPGTDSMRTFTGLEPGRGREDTLSVRFE
ncbi:MAG: alkaline phosphatase D family protein [Gemmatimonadota bacterium]|nr:MAG: alkaline phosphatase D family protein [Gemmatimonadota bacterium]